MPETLLYSTVCAVHTLWLAARAEGVGLGWVSILDPAPVGSDLAVPDDWRFVASLCLGYPEAAQPDPELARDRTCVVSGKSVAVRVDGVGQRIINKKQSATPTKIK